MLSSQYSSCSPADLFLEISFLKSGVILIHQLAGVGKVQNNNAVFVVHKLMQAKYRQGRKVYICTSNRLENSKKKICLFVHRKIAKDS